MKLGFWRFPSISCQAGYLEVSLCILSSKALVHNVQQICFSSGLGFFCCLNHLTSNVREALLHRMCSNPLTPDSSTSGAVTLISKGQVLLCSLFFHQWLLPPHWWLQPPVHSALESSCSLLALPQSTRQAVCCTSKGTFASSYPKSVHLPLCDPLAGGKANRNIFFLNVV